MASSSDHMPIRYMRAWLLLVGALAVHVLDEALTNFLDFYNPLVLSIRSQLPWFPMAARGEPIPSGYGGRKTTDRFGSHSAAG
jgi:hypothetical protein